MDAGATGNGESMSGSTVPLHHRHQCDASGKDYTKFIRRGVPNEHNIMNCPGCGKRVTLREKGGTGKFVVIPRHLELIVGL